MSQISKLKLLLGDVREGYSKALFAMHEFIEEGEKTVAAMQQSSPRQAVSAMRKLGLGANEHDREKALRIISVTASACDLDVGRLQDKHRGPRYDNPRGVAMLLVYEFTRLHHGEMADLFRRERSNLSATLTSLRRRLQHDPALVKTYERVRRLVVEPKSCVAGKTTNAA